MSALVLFAPASVDSKDAVDSDLIVVRRPALRSYTGKSAGHVDERLSIAVEAYAAGGETECVGVDGAGQPIYGGRRVPLHTEIVWCTRDERDQWDRGTGGSPGRPRHGSSNPVTAYLTQDAPAVQRAIDRAKEALRAARSAEEATRPALTMTPLHALLAQRVARARGGRPDLSDAQIARASGLTPSAFSRAMHACSAHTLAAVLGALAEMTGERIDIGLVEAPYQTTRP